MTEENRTTTLETTPQTNNNGTANGSPPPTPTAQAQASPVRLEDLSVEQQREIAQKWLETASPNDILSHRRVGGILGQRTQSIREQITNEVQNQLAQKARQDAEAELARLANEDHDEFVKRYMSLKEQDKIREQQAAIAAGIEKDFSDGIGEALKAFPEFSELTPEEFNKLQQAVTSTGGSRKEILAAYTRAATEVISDRKARKQIENFRSKELEKEREALRQEEAAKLLQKSARPDLAPASNPGQARGIDPTTLSDKDFDKYYRENFLSRM